MVDDDGLHCIACSISFLGMAGDDMQYSARQIVLICKSRTGDGMPEEPTLFALLKSIFLFFVFEELPYIMKQRA